MRYQPSTDNARTLEALASESRELIKNLKAPASIGYVWSPEALAYVTTK